MFILLCWIAQSPAQSLNKSSNSTTNNSNDLLEQFVKSKGDNLIVFDALNIKQFWIDKSISAQNNSISILLHKTSMEFESPQQRIQLKNVNGSHDCKIEIVAESSDFHFSIFNNESSVVSTSIADDNFINYHVETASFHLEDVPNFSFFIKFFSQSQDNISIKKIILSFSNNKNFLSSPGTLHITKNNSIILRSQLTPEQETFSVSGVNSRILAKNRILINDNTLSSSITIKNTGVTPAQVFIGYMTYSKDSLLLDKKNYPYKSSSKVLKVNSASEGTNKIIVDKFDDWSKGTFIALNANEDKTDIPNISFLDGTVFEIKQLENGNAEIIMDKPVNRKMEKGTQIRIHGVPGAFLYTNIKILQPGQEETFTNTIKKDNSYLEYYPKAFSKGVYYVIPLVLSYSVDNTQKNTIEIVNFKISY